VEAVRIIVGSVVLEEPEQSMQRPLAAMRPSSVWGQVAGCQGCFNQRWTREASPSSSGIRTPCLLIAKASQGTGDGP
jgi:hypothetical protein